MKKMSWKECVDQGIITEGIPDPGRSDKMLEMANIRLEFWSKKIPGKYIALKVEAYYDIIKDWCLLICTRKALTALTIYA